MIEHELIGKADVATFCHLSLSSINRLENLGLFPSRILLGKRKVMWFKNDLVNWLEAQKKPVQQIKKPVSKKIKKRASNNG